MDRIVESQALEPVAFSGSGTGCDGILRGNPRAPVKLTPEMEWLTNGGPGCLYAAHWPDWVDPWSEQFSLRAGREWFEKRMAVTLAPRDCAKTRKSLDRKWIGSGHGWHCRLQRPRDERIIRAASH